jgi:hypothetical protein
VPSAIRPATEKNGAKQMKNDHVSRSVSLL